MEFYMSEQRELVRDMVRERCGTRAARSRCRYPLASRPSSPLSSLLAKYTNSSIASSTLPGWSAFQPRPSAR